jgi:hypothetical protein
MMHNKGGEENGIQEGDNYMQDLEHKLGNFKEAKRNYEEEVVQCLV